ncbi:MAG: acyl-CoA dehydratase activase-related protein [Promethearchaeota archaeon]
MIVSFPNMGPNWVAFKTYFEQNGCEVIVPEPTNRNTIKFGVRHSPEFVCFPFKATLGDFKNALDQGADTLVMAVDCGPCRFGFYASVQERILRDLGYKDFRLIPLEQGDLLTFNWVKTLFQTSPFSDYKRYAGAVKAVIFFLKKAKLIEDIQTAEGIFRAYENVQGGTTRVVKDLLIRLDETNTLKGLRNFRTVIKDSFNAMDLDKSRNPPRVGLSGEIHISLEPYVNLDIRKKFGELGCEVHQSLSLYDWIMHKLHLNYHRKWLEHLARPHIPMDIGGECVWVLGEYIDKANAGFDGFVHSYPFTCMPEVVARTVITNKLKKIYDLPVLYFSFDDQSGVEGMRTRIEAFIDLMEGRRKKFEKKVQKEYGNHFCLECIKLVQSK